jgi:argininosuccinate lyase
LTIEEYQQFSPLFKEDIYEILQPKNVVGARNSQGGTGFEQVKNQLAFAEQYIN